MIEKDISIDYNIKIKVKINSNWWKKFESEMFMKNNKLKKIIASILLVALLVVWGTNDIVTSEYFIGSEKIPSDFDGYRIVQVSDLHNKEFGKNQKRLIQKIKTANPDLIVITGDIVDRRKWGTKYMEEFLSEAKGIAPMYYVSGNHEVWSFKYDKVKKILEKYDVNILDDDVKTIKYKNSEIKIAGIIDTGFEDREEYVPEILKTLKNKIKSNEYSILLSHRPEHIDDYADAGYDLVFSGHAHGGQIRIPFIGGIYAPHQGFMPKYTKGVINKKKTKMVVSRGLGNSVIPIRILNRPEITITVLKSNW